MSAIASPPLDNTDISYLTDIPTPRKSVTARYILYAKYDKEEIRRLAEKFFNVSNDDRDKLINLFENFKEKNKKMSDQMNFILRNHVSDVSDLESFLDFAVNYTIHTGIPILDLENKENYEKLKKDPRYTQEACNYVADVLALIRLIIIAGKIGNIKIRNVGREIKTQITRGIEKTIDRLRRIERTRKKAKWIA